MADGRQPSRALIISEGKGSPPKQLTLVAGKGKEIDLSGNFKTPNLLKFFGFHPLKALNPEASSSSKNIFVNRLDDPNAIPALGSKINADCLSSVHNNVPVKAFIDSAGIQNECNGVIANPVLQDLFKSNVVFGNLGNPWKKSLHIKINFNKEKLVFSEDGKAVKLDESCEIINAKRLEYSVVTKVRVDISALSNAWSLWKKFYQVAPDIGGLGATAQVDHMDVHESYGPWILVKHNRNKRLLLSRNGKFRSNSAKQSEGHLLKMNAVNQVADKSKKDVLGHLSIVEDVNLSVEEGLFENCDTDMLNCSSKIDGLVEGDSVIVVDNSKTSNINVANKFEALGVLAGAASLEKSDNHPVEVMRFNSVIAGTDSSEKVFGVEGIVDASSSFSDGKDAITASIPELPNNVLSDAFDQGGKEKDASRYLKEIVMEHGAFFVGLVETKIDSLDKFEFKQMMGDNWDFFICPSNGLSGGILTCWRSDLVSFSVVQASSQVIVGELNYGLEGVWLIATVYGDSNCYKKEKLWKCLENPSFSKLPFVVGGDFNCILSQDEKKGGKKFVLKQGALDMLTFMRNFDFHEVQVVGHDILILSQATLKNARLNKSILGNYCSWTGQKINYSKSAILFGKHVKKRRKKSLSKSLNIKIVKEMDYLGVKMALRRLVVADFHGILEKTSNRLNVWGNKFISTVGRMQLVNSSCLSIPIFIATHSLIPARVLHVIEKM
ncbi:hypothetical protein M5K25_024637 [Dendrobium thyrsiflorum]|uniref:Uncharacterized protein n=1 Tax=Dendrobium thyrsiflorum TaxID=117978 RepID=A0ABD0U2R7_DENTH